MFSILSAVSAETIIGIVAIIVIVISSGIIIATAIRNYLLHKKAMLEAEQNEGFEDFAPVQEIESNQEEAVQESNDPTITAEDEESATQTQGIENEFAEDNEEVQPVQEIEFEKQNVADENATKIDVDDVTDNIIKQEQN